MRSIAFALFFAFALGAMGLEDFFGLVLKDENGDGIYDSSRYQLVFDENDPAQLALASEIAYRLGFEAGEYIDLLAPEKRKIFLTKNSDIESGLAFIHINGKNLYIEAKDKEGFLSAREFFWRYPYYWKTSKFTGITWKEIIAQIGDMLKSKNIESPVQLIGLKIRGRTSPFSSTYLENGQVEEAIFAVRNIERVGKLLSEMEKALKMGKSTDALNFPYIAKITFAAKNKMVSIDRFGAPEEFFRPSYGVFPKKKIKRKAPQMMALLSSPVAVLLEKGAGKGAVNFAFRAGLEAKEARFPIAFFREKEIPEGRTVVVIGKGKVSREHGLKGESRGLCMEKGEKRWFLKSGCAPEFSKDFFFPALNREKNLYFSKFFLEKLRFSVPLQAQKELAKGINGEPYIEGKIYGKKLIYKEGLSEKDEVQRFKGLIKNLRYTMLTAYLSESPERRKSLEEELGEGVEIRSAYKTGFFWIKEEIIPEIKGADEVIIYVKRVKGGKQEEILSSPNQFLYELYPIDEIINRELKIPLDKVKFVLEDKGPIHRVEALKGGKVYRSFELNPPIVNAPFPRTEGWVFAWKGKELILSRRIKTDPELAWDFYKNKFLPWLVEFINKRTDGKPTWDKQPFFSFIEINFEAPEPDFPLGIDYEIVSSTEALHDELYFYTLYYISRILKPGKDGGSIRAHLYPGAIIPLIRTSKQGVKFQVKVYDYRKPGIYNRDKVIKKFYPEGKVKYEILGWAKDKLWVKFVFENQEDFLLYSEAFSKIKEMKFPVNLILSLKYKSSKKDYEIEGRIKPLVCKNGVKDWSEPIPPEDAACQASLFKYSYPVAESFLGRRLYAIEKVSSTGTRYSAPHFTREKPTVVFNARQHANEVCSTSYLLKFLLEKKDSTKVNLIADPVENPDGAAIAINMMKKESPLHSLHAGRYNALGTDIGFHLKEFSPYAPSGFARNKILSRWKPDIFLNLHGYPSHEWVQQFTGYLPFPYRNYWIPRGHFFYLSSAENPTNKEFSEQSLEMLKFVTKKLTADKKIDEFNKRLYGRYFRWARRWNPHAFKMNIENGYNVYWKDSRKISFQSQPLATLFSEVPEYIDETARGALLKYLIHCGEEYLKAHVEFLIKNRKKPIIVFTQSPSSIKLIELRKRW